MEFPHIQRCRLEGHDCRRACGIVVRPDLDSVDAAKTFDERVREIARPTLDCSAPYLGLKLERFSESDDRRLITLPERFHRLGDSDFAGIQAHDRGLDP
jgi:hypothetical protein